ncbi:putative membrane protein [Streptomyces avermitilis MA-4680 = NBRC 14893]|uniref:Membrane protein n=2 Tax=Streptomyces avermitilis TaxID=33903 RepID=Q82KL6_STRAW|nr:putative membrane protein [Streptomyces avermitilis MA-4680 = NBRC 14893]
MLCVALRMRRAHTEKKPTRSEGAMIVLGVILLVIGLLTGISILWTIGVVLVVIGLILWILGAVGHAVGGRRHYW